MADNFNVTPGGGITLRTRDINGSGKHAQYIYVATAEASVVNCQQATIGTTAGTLASFLTGAAVPTGATHALVSADSANTGVIRYWDDGSTPTATTGLELAARDASELVNLANVKLIATAAGQKLNLSFRRYDQ